MEQALPLMTSAARIVTEFYGACGLIQSGCPSTAEETDNVCVDLLLSLWTGSGNCRSVAALTHTQKDTLWVAITSSVVTLDKK